MTNLNQASNSTKKRYNILAMVFITVVINYLDRSNISVAAFAMKEDMGLSNVQMGYVFSAFAWTYACLQIRRNHSGQISYPNIVFYNDGLVVCGNPYTRYG
ncbi:hypothetical protein [Zobellia laminariae]|uniref:hypothetical protein n=1 Tax=Zobellia laminariae TaxID=248906 RepID=UPI0026F425CA|nr:hypothetical protein [Zobellia laminariae]WKX75521.1 hypothetical protein Q5W13_18010 [Zobellia laminariae]